MPFAAFFFFFRCQSGHGRHLSGNIMGAHTAGKSRAALSGRDGSSAAMLAHRAAARVASRSVAKEPHGEAIADGSSGG